MKRLFVDFARITRKTKVTGIPRVTFEYFTRLLDLSLRHGGEWVVYPVCIEGAGHAWSCLHALPPRIITCYLDYLEQMDRLRPELRLSGLADILKLKIEGRQQDSGTTASVHHGVPLRRKLAHMRRAMLTRIAGIDPVLKNLVKFHTKGRNVLDSPELDSIDEFKLVENHVFHQTGEGDVCFMPAFWHDIDPMGYFSLRQAGVSLMPMLHDLLPVVIPDKYNKSWSRHFHFNVYITCLISEAIIAISRATRRDLEHLMASHSHPLPEVHVLHHGFDFKRPGGSAASSDRFPKDERYFLMVGSIEPKKNHSLVIDQFLRVSEQHPGVRLKIIGFPGWMHDEISAKLARTIHDGSPVDHYKDVDDDELAIAYSHALANIMASSHEGFGLPVIESLALGCPLILSDIPVFREIAGNTGSYFAPDVPETLGLAMLNRLEHSAPATIKDFCWPSWDDQASKLFETLTGSASQLSKSENSRRFQ